MNWRSEVRRFVLEDVGFGDVTTRAVLPPRKASAVITAQEACVVAGLREACEAFHVHGAHPRALVKDGARVKAGTAVLRIHGEAWALLASERTGLNLLMRMSGIATATAELAALVAAVNKKAKVAATRKTAPGLREFDKRAVELGGGWPHRKGLFDAILIKDNHLKIVALEEALKRAKRTGLRVEVEVESVAQARVAAEAQVDMVLLDNMKPALAARAFTAVKRLSPKTLVEVSGGLTRRNIARYAKCADLLSVGALTHSVKAIDFSMDLTPD